MSIRIEGGMDINWFPILLFLHVLGAIVAFGPTFTFPFIGAMVGKEPQHGNFALRVSHTLAGRLVYPIGITLPITGTLMILVKRIDLASPAYRWLGLAIVLYIIIFGYSYFVQNKIVERVIEMTSAPPPPGASGPPPGLLPLVRRIQRGGMVMTVVLVAIIFLMAVKPQL